MAKNCNYFIGLVGSPLNRQKREFFPLPMVLTETIFIPGGGNSLDYIT